MSLWSKLLERINTSLSKSNGISKTSGELISEVTDRANLVNEKQTWELFEDKKMILNVWINAYKINT